MTRSANLQSGSSTAPRPLRLAGFALLTVLTAPVAALAQPQGACRPPARNTATFLPDSPADAGFAVMARVELINLVDARTPRGRTSDDATASKVRVRVLFPIKGVGRDDVFLVDTGGSGCDETVGFDRLGQKAFIAGRFVTDRNDRTYFVGQHDLPAR